MEDGEGVVCTNSRGSVAAVVVVLFPEGEEEANETDPLISRAARPSAASAPKERITIQPNR